MAHTRIAEEDIQTKTPTRGFLKRHKSVIWLLLIGFVGGIVWMTAMRFFLIRSEETHYHANFAVYINGEREPFEEFTYYEEVAACTAEYDNNPKGRVHMHDNVNDVIHVHDKRVTYGNFFNNLGWGVGEDYLATPTEFYQSGSAKRVVYILNGSEVDSITNRVIGNTDRLLVSYGDTNTDFQAQFESVASSAEVVNSQQDPATCSGLNGAGHDSFLNRLKGATFWE